MKKLLCVALLSALASPAFALGVTSIEITGGTFAWSMEGNVPHALTPGASNVISLPAEAPIGSQESPVVQGSFFYTPFWAYLAKPPTTESVPVTAEIVDGSISIDLTEWIWHWNGTMTRSGGIATGTTTSTGLPGQYEFNVGWSSVDIGGPTNGNTTTWTLTGYAQAVPEPATYVMLLAGIVLIASRSRNSLQRGRD